MASKLLTKSLIRLNTRNANSSGKKEVGPQVNNEAGEILEMTIEEAVEIADSNGTGAGRVTIAGGPVAAMAGVTAKVDTAGVTGKVADETAATVASLAKGFLKTSASRFGRHESRSTHLSPASRCPDAHSPCSISQSWCWPGSSALR